MTVEFSAQVIQWFTFAFQLSLIQ